MGHSNAAGSSPRPRYPDRSVERATTEKPLALVPEAHPPLSLLLLAADPSSLGAITSALSGIEPSALRIAQDIPAYEILKGLPLSKYDVALLHTGDAAGLSALVSIRSSAPTLPVVVVGNAQSEEAALEALRRGAQDYVALGDLDAGYLLKVLRRAVARKSAEVVRNRLALDALAESERLASLIANVDVALTVVGADGRLQMINDAALRRLGVTREQVAGLQQKAIAEMPGVPQLLEMGRRVLDTGESIVLRDYPVASPAHPEGYYVDGTLQPMRDAEGRVTAVFTASIDVTEKVAAIRNAEAQRSLLEAMIDNSSSAIVYFDREMRVVRANRSWSNMTGIDIPSAVGRSLYDLALGSPERREAYDEAFTGVPQDVEAFHYKHTDGTDRYVDVAYRPVRASSGEVVGLLMTASDVTDKMRARKESDAHRSLLEAIIEGVPVGLLMVDVDLRVLTFNDEWGRYSGYNLEEVKGHYIYDFLPSAQERRDLHQRVLQGESFDLRDVPIPSPRLSKLLYFDLHLRPIREPDGTIRGLISASIDVTERHELDLRKDDFISMTSHELRTPVTSIKGFAQMSLRAARELGNDRLTGMLTRINEQSERLTRLIDELLDVGRLQNGEMDLHLETFDLCATVSDATRSVELTSPGFSITTALPPGPVSVDGDRHRIEQVILNLLQNAVKYSGSSRNVEVTVAHREDDAIVSVRDYGVGIPKKQQARVFERFFRASNVTSGGHTGLGLGMYISTGIVSRHGGRMWLESEEGKGTTFYFSIPLPRSLPE